MDHYPAKRPRGVNKGDIVATILIEIRKSCVASIPVDVIVLSNKTHTKFRIYIIKGDLLFVQFQQYILQCASMHFICNVYSHKAECLYIPILFYFSNSWPVYWTKSLSKSRQMFFHRVICLCVRKINQHLGSRSDKPC